MDERSLLALKHCHDAIVKDLCPKEICVYFVPDFTESDLDVIKSKVTRLEQVECFLLTYKRRFTSLDRLIAVLQGSYEHLASDLSGYLATANTDTPQRHRHFSAQQIETLLRRGGVPSTLVDGYVQRDSLLARLKAALESLSKSCEVGYVLLHGMSGSGKSVLAAKTLRDMDVVGPGRFFEFVFWLHVGKLNTAGTDQQSRLIILVTMLFAMLDAKSEHNISSLEEGVTRIRYMLMNEYPKALIVLDDVWDPSVLRQLNFQNRILVTSRNGDLLDAVAGEKFLVALDPPQLSQEEAVDVFCKVLGKFRKDLPWNEFLTIYNKYQGLPFPIFLVAKLLQRHDGHLSKWKSIAQKTQEALVSLSGKTVYEHPHFEAAAQTSIEDLSETDKKHFCSLAIFENGAKILNTVLSTYWGVRLDEVDDTMKNFCDRSLAIKSCVCIDDDTAVLRPTSPRDRDLQNREPVFAYTIHDLFFPSMKKENASILGMSAKDARQHLNAKLIRAYQTKCPNGYYQLPNDGYILWHFADHLYASRMSSINAELATAFLDLRFIELKLVLCNAANTLGDLVKYWNYIGTRENEQARLDFKRFISRNATKFRHNNVIQLALLEPTDSEVYVQAKRIACEKPTETAVRPTTSAKEYFFDLINKPKIYDPYFLACKPHDDSISFGQFLPRASLFVSCSYDKTVKICHVRSGEESATIGRHKEFVTCCAISPQKKKLVIAVHKVLKVYDIRRYWDQDLKSLGASAGSDDGLNLSALPPRKLSSASLLRVSERELTDSQSSSSESLEDDCELILTGHTETIAWVEFAPSPGSATPTYDFRRMALEDRYTILASCGSDRLIRLWDLNRCSENGRLSGPVQHLQFNTSISPITPTTPNAAAMAKHRDGALVSTPAAAGSSHLVANGGPKFHYLPLPRPVDGQGDSSTLTQDGSGASVPFPRDGSGSSGKSNGAVRDITPPSTAITPPENSEPCLLAIVTGHKGVVNCVRFTPDGALFVSASNDRTIKVWALNPNETSGNVVQILHTIFFNYPIQMCAFARCGALAGQLIGVHTEFIFVCNVQKGLTTIIAPLSLTKPADSVPTCFDVSPDGSKAAVGLSDGTIAILNTEAWNTIATLLGHSAYVQSVTFGPEDLLMSTADDASAMIWNLCEVQPGRHLLNSAFFAVFLRDVDSSPVVLATNHKNRACLVAIDGTTEAILGELDFSGSIEGDVNKRITCLDVSIAGDFSLVGLADGIVAFVTISPVVRHLPTDGDQDTETDNQNSLLDLSSVSLMPHACTVTQAVISRSGRRFASGDASGNIHVWARESVLVGDTTPAVVPNRDPTNVPETGVGVNKIIFFHDDSDRFLTCTKGGSVCVWGLTSGITKMLFWKRHLQNAVDCDLSVDCKLVASGSLDGSVKVWDWQSQTELLSWNGQRQTVATPAQLLLPHTPKLRGAKRLPSFRQFSIRTVRFSPSGQKLAVGSDDGKVRIWGIANKDLLQTLCGEITTADASVKDLLFSPNEQFLVTTSCKYITWWHIKNALPVQSIPLVGLCGEKLFCNEAYHSLIQSELMKPFSLFVTIDATGCLFVFKALRDNW